MLTSIPTNESSCWMTSVGVPLDDVLYLRRMAAYAGHGVETVCERIKEIQDAAYDALIESSMVRKSASAFAQ